MRVDESTPDDGTRTHVQHLEDLIETLVLTKVACQDSILDAADLLKETFKNGNKLLLCGNGGSAADCQHMAAELVPLGFPAIALTTDTSFITAWSNDHGFLSIFQKQVQTLGRPGDTLIAISTSGESSNVIHGVGVAVGMHTIGLTGSADSRLSRIVDVAIQVPSTNTQHIQEANLAIEHILVELVNDNK